MSQMTESETKLALEIIETLNLEDISIDEIEPDEPLFAGGLELDSIDALEIAVMIAKNYGIHLKAEDEETKEVFRSVRSLSKYISEQSK